jgi:hypothetical protein
MKILRTLALIGVCSSLVPLLTAAEPGVKPAGAFALSVPGLSSAPSAKSNALLWCQGPNLVGVVVLDDKPADCGTGSGSQKRSAPKALLVRDGRCEADGSSVSFGFLLSRKSWAFVEGAKAPQERTVWLVNRFEGSLKAGQLRGAVVQVDVNHPGYPFQKKTVEADAMPTEQASFNDEPAWRASMWQTYCLSATEP